MYDATIPMEGADHNTRDASADRVPIMVIGGFLGGGKTTLINHLLATGDPRRRMAVIVNDFGQINVDTGLIEFQNEAVLALRNGCVCCSLGPQLASGLVQVLEQVQPDLVLIEGSGITQMGQLAGVLAQGSLAETVVIERVVVVADVVRLPKLIGSILTVDEQISVADLVLLNRCDQVDKAQQQIAMDSVRSVNRDVPIIKTVRGRIMLDQLLAVSRDRHAVAPVPLRSVPPHQEHTQWTSVTLQKSGPVGEDALRDLLSRLPMSVFRVKGFVACEPGVTLVVQVVQDMVELIPVNRPIPQEIMNRLVFVGSEAMGEALAVVSQRTSWLESL